MTSHLSHMRWGSNRQHLRELPLTFCGCNRYLWVWLGMDPERKYIINIYFLSEWTVYPEFVNSVTSRITWSVSFIDVRPTGYPVTSRISYSVYFKYIRYLAEYLSWYPVWGWIFVLISDIRHQGRIFGQLISVLFLILMIQEEKNVSFYERQRGRQK